MYNFFQRIRHVRQSITILALMHTKLILDVLQKSRPRFNSVSLSMFMNMKRTRRKSRQLFPTSYNVYIIHIYKFEIKFSERLDILPLIKYGKYDNSSRRLMNSAHFPIEKLIKFFIRAIKIFL